MRENKIKKSKSKDKDKSGGRVKRWRRGFIAAQVVVMVGTSNAWAQSGDEGMAQVKAFANNLANYVTAIAASVAVLFIAINGVKYTAAVAYLRRRRHERADTVPDTDEPEAAPERTARARKFRAKPVEERPTAADTAPAEPDAPQARSRRRLPWWPVVVAAVAVVAVAAVRWPRPDPVPPVTRVVVVPVPVPAPDPWEEEIDDAVDAWVAAALGG